MQAFFVSVRNIISESNSLDPDLARHCVGPDLGPNCLQMQSIDNNTNWQKFEHDISMTGWTRVSDQGDFISSSFQLEMPLVVHFVKLRIKNDHRFS